MKDLFFTSWHSWKVCFMSGISKLCWGFMRIITCILLGIVSVFVWLWHMLCDFVGRNPKISVGGFVVIAFLIWMLTFVCMRARAIGAENQRDAIAWQYYDFKTQHGYYE